MEQEKYLSDDMELTPQQRALLFDPDLVAQEIPKEERDCFLDRELSWLQFDLRVLQQAADKTVPLMERLRFLSIYFNNMQEFFMVRVGSLSYRRALLPDFTDPKTGWTAGVQIEKICHEVSRQQVQATAIYKTLLDDLREKNIEVVNFKRLSKVDEAISHKFFAELRPRLSPVIVDETHPMPFLPGGEETVCVLLSDHGKDALGFIPMQGLLSWQVYETDGKQKVFLLSELLGYFAARIFPEQEVRETVVLRLTRNADVFIEKGLHTLDKDIRTSIQKMLGQRKKQEIVSIRVDGRPSEKFLSMMADWMAVPQQQIFCSPVPMALSFGRHFKDKTLFYPERKPARNINLHKGDFFPYLEKHDILMAFPFQSMTPFVELLYEAADDPQVESIRITLYRLSHSSKVAAALAYAADRGKRVQCLLELRARFDEQNNIDYSEMLESAGCQVCYGLPDYKVHGKVCLITRRVGDSVKTVTQIGSGNYNEVTSEQYCDLSLITADPKIGAEANALFDSMTRGEVPYPSEALWIAPDGYKTRLLSLLRQEEEKGKDGYVSIKVNSLNDTEVMRQLIACSKAGVSVELFVRGICCIRPGLEGYTENITVKSVVGRYLEHSRIFVFGRGDKQRVFMGSGDLLNRNTKRRVEVFAQATDPDVKAQLLEVMDALHRDREKGWVMSSDGTYHKEKSGASSSQEYLWRYFAHRTVDKNGLPKPKMSLRRLLSMIFRKR